MAYSESSVQSVISNNDLLTEILVRLPVLSLILFKSVSKRWFSLIKYANLTFCRNLDPLAGLFLEKCSSRYDFVPLDIRIQFCRSSLLATNFTCYPEVHGDVYILDSCNGLLLCRTSSWKLYVCNPSITNMFKLINVTFPCKFYGFLRIAFDPTKSLHYKVIYAEIVKGDSPWDKLVQIHTFSSETGNWSLCGPQFPRHSFAFFANDVYWNDSIYWINEHCDHICKLDIMNECPVLTTLRKPLTLDVKVCHECMLFESRGCLLLVGKDHAVSRDFSIYEKGNVDSEWSMKHIVNLDDIIKPCPEGWITYRTLYCIVLGEREEDSFLVMRLDKKVVQYKIASKTVITISDLGPNDDLVTCFQFIPSLANV